MFSEGQIYDRVWGACYVVDDRNIAAYINKIRKNLAGLVQVDLHSDGMGEINSMRR